MVEALLAAGASVEAKDDDGRGPQRRDGCDRDATRHGVCCQFWELRSRNLQCTLRDCMLRSQVPVDTSYKFDNIIQSGSGG